MPARFGGASVELDALPPDLLTALVEWSIASEIDREAWQRIAETEELEAATLESIALAGWVPGVRYVAAGGCGMTIITTTAGSAAASSSRVARRSSPAAGDLPRLPASASRRDPLRALREAAPDGGTPALPGLLGSSAPMSRPVTKRKESR